MLLQHVLHVIFWNSWLIQADTLKYAVISDTSRLDIKEAVNLAIANLNKDSSILNGHKIEATFFETSGEDRFNIIRTLCNKKPVENYDGVVDVSTTPGRCSSLSIAHHLDTPFMSAFGERCFSAEAPSVRFSDDFYFRAMAKVALRQNATREAMAIFYDDSFDIGTMLPMEDVDWYVPTYMFKLPATAEEIITLVAKVKKDTPASEFLVASTTNTAEVVISAAQNNSLISTLYHWFVLTRDLENFTCIDCGSAMVVNLKHQVVSENLLSDLKTAISYELWNNLTYKRLDAIFAYEAIISLTKVVDTIYNSTLWNNSPTFTCFNPQVINLKRYNNYITQLKELKKYPGIISEINFNNSVYSDDVSFEIETCSQRTCSSADVIYNSRLNQLVGSGSLSFNHQTKMHLKVLALEEPPFIYVKDGVYSGYSVAVLKYISEKLNFDFSIIEPDDGKYGVKLSDGSWNGMIGQVSKGYADIALGPITITAERDVVVDFTIPYYDYAGLQIVMKKAGSSGHNNMFYFLTVFTTWVWLCIGATLLLTGILVTVFDKLSPYSYQNRTDDLKEGEPEGKIFTFKESMWFVLGAYTQAGESFDPRATSTRMLVAGFWIFSCIMMAMYTANLAAFLTVSKLTATISSVRQLASQTDVPYSVQSDTSGYVFFERMKNIEANFFNIWKDISIGNEYTVGDVSKYSVWEYPIEERYTDMFDRMKKWGFFNSTKEGIARVKDEKKPWAVFMETPMIKYHMSKDCELVNTGEILSSRPYGIVLQNNSPLTRQFNTIILEMQRDRVLENYKVDWWEKEKVTCPMVESNTGIKLETLGGVFIFLAGGIGLGAIVLVIEIIVARVFGTERFKPTSNVVTHLAPRPATTIHSRNTVRRRSNAAPTDIGHVNGSFSNGDSKMRSVSSQELNEIRNGSVQTERAHTDAGFRGNWP